MGWPSIPHDPRFAFPLLVIDKENSISSPGIRRRGLTVEALSQFMLAQGPSQAIVSLEWDSIWALNKKVIDPIAPRYWAIVKENMWVSATRALLFLELMFLRVGVSIKGGPTTPEVKVLPKHKKNAAVGEKKTVYTSSILIEQEDALSFDDQEEVHGRLSPYFISAKMVTYPDHLNGLG
jgi:glutamyl-tRNA synthetase